jgi:hypothetical protein
MNTKNLLFVIGTALITSCTATYKNIQTPDDVYYSPAARIDVEEEKKKEENIRNNQDETRFDRQRSNDSRWRNRERGVEYNPYDYIYGVYRPTTYYYNPKYCPVPVYIFNDTTRNNNKANLGTYTSTPQIAITAYDPKTGTTSSFDPKTGEVYTPPTPKKTRYNNSNSGGGILGTIFNAVTGSNNSGTKSTNTTNTSTSRDYTPKETTSGNSGNNSGSNGSGTSGSGTPVARPGRGGN